MDPEKLKAIVDILEGTDVSFVEWRSGDERWTIRRGSAPPEGGSALVSAPPAYLAGPLAVPPPAPAGDATPATGGSPGAVQVTSPFVGTFYRSSSPDSDPFVEIGTIVSPGQTLCIIEAMKLMNEIECEVSGRVVGVPVQNGETVEYGEVLFEIEPT